jgi:hypothetical protein
MFQLYICNLIVINSVQTANCTLHVVIFHARTETGRCTNKENKSLVLFKWDQDHECDSLKPQRSHNKVVYLKHEMTKDETNKDSKFNF